MLSSCFIFFAAGKSRLKFEMRSYQEMVVSQFRQMSEDNQQLNWFKNRFSRVQTHARALEESLGVVTEKLRQTAEDSRIVRQRTKVQHEENKEEVFVSAYIVYSLLCSFYSNSKSNILKVVLFVKYLRSIASRNVYNILFVWLGVRKSGFLWCKK